MTKSTFRVWCDDFGEDEETGRTITLEYGCAEEAATEFVERLERDACEYPVASGNLSREVTVKDKAGKVTTWRVEGEPRPHYRAHLIPKITPTEESKP